MVYWSRSLRACRDFNDTTNVLGWSHLGFNLTVSLLSIALAFDSPVLKGVNSAVGARDVVRDLGSMKLKYVVTDQIAPCQEQATYDYASGRLGIAESQNVAKSRRGMKFCK